MIEQAYQFIIEQLGSNDLIAGGAVLGAIAYVLNYLRSVPFTILRWMRLLFITEIDIPDRADTFRWVTEWLAQHNYSKRAKRISVDAKNSKARITPAPGRHLVWWGRRPIILNRVRREGTGDNAHRAFRESWAISLFGKRKGIEKFLEECRKVAQTEKDSTIQVTTGSKGYWDSSVKCRKRSIESVILPPDEKEKLTTDLNLFMESEEWYHEMNIPWRRGYLLYGPPGNGKSSIITAVASMFNFEIATLNLKNMEEEDFVSLMCEPPDKSILLFEDIDCIFEKRKDKSVVNLSTVLNMIDGVGSPNGRILFMTTNYLEKLDPALIRPGRIDHRVHLTNTTESQAKEMFCRFFPHSKNSEEFGKKVAKLDVSMATLQGYLLRHRDSMHNARANLGELSGA